MNYLVISKVSFGNPIWMALEGSTFLTIYALTNAEIETFCHPNCSKLIHRQVGNTKLV